MTEYKIEKGIVIPPKQLKKNKYPFVDMEIGDSIAFPIKERSSVSSAVNNFKNHIPQHRFTIRKISDTECRVWRIK